MAEGDFTVEQLEKLAEAGALSRDELESLVQQGLVSQDVFSQLSNVFASSSDSLKDVASSAMSASEAFSKMIKGGVDNLPNIGGAFDKLQGTISKFTTAFIDQNEKTDNKLIESGVILQSVMLPQFTEGSKLFGNFGDVGADASRKLSGNLGALEGVLGKRTKELIRMHDASVDVKTAIFNMSTATGSANELMEKGVLSMDKLDKASASYTNKVNQVAKATGMASDDVSEFLASVGSKIPGALNMLSDAADKSGNHIDTTVKMLKLASSIGMDHTDVLERTANAYVKYGTSVDKALDNLALMNQTTQNMEINQDVMLGFIDKATSGMEAMSDATDSVVKMMGSLGKVMREEGTSMQGVSDILGGMSERAKGMDIGQASFINQMAGGRGGLAGGFEIERLKQEGDIGEIVNRTMQAMEKIGVGTPVTLQDVDKNPALAGELMKQTELLQQFGLAGDRQEAFRVLDAMKAGGQDELQDALEGMKDPQERMVEQMESANELQSLGNQALRTMVNSTDHIARTNAMLAGEGLQRIDEATGAEGGVRRLNFGKAEIAGVTNRLTDAETGVIGDVDTRETMRTIPRKAYSEFASDIENIAKPFADILTKQMKEALEKIKEKSSEMVTSADTRDDALKNAQKTPQQQQQQQQGNVGTKLQPIEGVINLDINMHDNLQPIMQKSFAIELEKMQKKAFTGT